MTRILVTGATGFTGRRVVAALARAGHDVTAFVRPSSDFAVADSLGVPLRIGDLADGRTLERALAGPDALVHVASLGTGLGPVVAAAAERAGVRRSVVFSTSAVRTRLPSPTKEVRLAGERAALDAPIGATVLRPTMIYGAPGDRNVERLIRVVARWKVVPIPGSGRGLQQPVHVDDLADAVVALVDRADLAGRTFELAGREPSTFAEMVRTVARVLDRRRILVHVPRPIVRLGTAAVGILRGRRVVSGEQLARLDEDKSTDLGPAREAFGFAPRPFTQGVAEEARALGLLGDRVP